MTAEELQAACLKFAALERTRYPASAWEQCECWINSDWEDFEPSVSWHRARYFIINAWNATAMPTPAHPLD